MQVMFSRKMKYGLIGSFIRERVQKLFLCKVFNVFCINWLHGFKCFGSGG